jgi:lipopolysaccharide transport system permease protein
MVYLGLLPWTFFSGAIVNSGNSIVGNAHLITKVYFPRMVIPAAAIGARLVDFAVSFVILAVLMVYYHVSLTANVLLLPVLLGILTLLALGLGMLISALNVKYRDIGVMLPVLVQLWMYASPVVYPLSLVPEKWRAFYIWNPMVGIIAGFRSALLGEAFQWPALAISTVITVALFVISSIVFRRVEKGFADFV